MALQAGAVGGKNMQHYLKGYWCRLLILLISFACLTGAGAAAAGSSEHPFEVFGTDCSLSNDNEDYSMFRPVDIIAVNPGIKYATPHYTLLLLGLDPANRENLISEIGRFSSVNETVKAEMTQSLTGIWDKYPLVTQTMPGCRGPPTYGGNFIFISFDPGLGENVMLTDEENAVMDLIERTRTGEWSPPVRPPKWNWKQHEDLAEHAAIQAGFPDELVILIKQESTTPDDWPTDTPKPLSSIIHSLEHYYNPEMYHVRNAYFVGRGYAPQMAKRLAFESHVLYLSGETPHNDRIDAAKKLGQATHFVTDVGNPMHTGKEYEQVSQGLLPPDYMSWAHKNYEGWVDANWGNGERYQDVVSGTTTRTCYQDWETGTKQNALDSHAELETLWTIVNGAGSDPDAAYLIFSDSTKLKDITRNRIFRTAQYANGMAAWVKNNGKC